MIAIVVMISAFPERSGAPASCELARSFESQPSPRLKGGKTSSVMHESKKETLAHVSVVRATRRGDAGWEIPIVRRLEGWEGTKVGPWRMYKSIHNSDRLSFFTEQILNTGSACAE